MILPPFLQSNCVPIFQINPRIGQRGANPWMLVINLFVHFEINLDLNLLFHCAQGASRNASLFLFEIVS